MAIPRSTAATWSLSALAAGLLLVGCSASVDVGSSEPKMSADKLADTVAEKLASTMNQPKPDVTCPEDLAGKTGTTTRCTLHGGRRQHPGRVRHRDLGRRRPDRLRHQGRRNGFTGSELTPPHHSRPAAARASGG